MLAKAFLLALAAVSVRASIPQKNFESIASNIVNGTDTTIQEFPFMASLQWEYNSTTWLHYCGGTILNANWVLTAGQRVYFVHWLINILKMNYSLATAHCVYGDVTAGNQVEYGMTVISHGSRASNIALYLQLIWHEKFNPYTLVNDIGLIKTTRMDVGFFEYRTKLPIPSDYFPTGTPAVLAGKRSLLHIGKLDCSSNFIRRLGPRRLGHANQRHAAEAGVSDIQQRRLCEAACARQHSLQ
jgi:hypothetical protein